MSRPTSREKHPASQVVIDFRRSMGWTQAELAAKLGISLPAVGGWESYKPPRGLSLLRLLALAEKVGAVRASCDLRAAYEAEKTGRQMPLWIGTDSDEESHHLFAVKMILRDERFVDLRPKLTRLLKPALEATEFMMSEQRRILEALAAKSKATTKKNKKKRKNDE